ncbi:MAG: hypothetical protein U0Z26_11420 [Anaerolineales bacterium]
MVEINEVLLKSNDIWLHFSKPYQIISVNLLEQVPEALHNIEREINENNWHAAGFVSYEAAPAFDPSMQTLTSTGNFPLLWFGLYPAPNKVNLPIHVQSKNTIDWQTTIKRESYNTAIEKIKEHIAQGKTYQVNYTMRLQANFDQNPGTFFYNLLKTKINMRPI